jgi:hypothetical protein
VVQHTPELFEPLPEFVAAAASMIASGTLIEGDLAVDNTPPTLVAGAVSLAGDPVVLAASVNGSNHSTSSAVSIAPIAGASGTISNRLAGSPGTAGLSSPAQRSSLIGLSSTWFSPTVSAVPSIDVSPSITAHSSPASLRRNTLEHLSIAPVR